MTEKFNCPERSRRTLNTLYTLLFYLSILIFIIGFNFSDTPLNGGWTQQFMPSIAGRQITDISFLDSLIGYAVTNNLSAGDTGYILKTTNSGENWNFSFTINRGFTAIEFINLDTGFACGGSGGGTTYLCKTTNAGLNWSLVNSPSAAKWQDMAVLSNDTLWLVDNDGLTGGVFRTTNGGADWTQQLALGSQNPTKIYFFNRNIGFVSKNTGSAYVRKTTNGGLNWDTIVDGEGFVDIYLADSQTGWRSYSGYIMKTVNGGLNWVQQPFPPTYITGVEKFTNVNRDTIWGVGGTIGFPNNQTRGIVYNTTNGGSNWRYQIPDTNINIFGYFHTKFVNELVGWAYGVTNGIHTTTGGDTTFYTGIQHIQNAVPEKFILKQNYPNPFNPRTVIPYSVSSSAYVKIIAYDIQGREVQKMVDSYHYAGAYEVDFMGKFTSTGVYLYRMTVTDEKLKVVYTNTKKMILLK